MDYNNDNFAFLMFYLSIDFFDKNFQEKLSFF